MNSELQQGTGVSNPLVLIQSAIEKGLDPDQLGKLLDLQERWERNLAVKAYSAAMNQAQAEMPAIFKDAMNRDKGNRYAKFESVNAAIKPIYTRHGLSVTFFEADCPIAGAMRLTSRVRHSLGYSEDFHVDMPLDGQSTGGKAIMTATQGKGSTVAYGKRYLLKMVFNLAESDEDKDGEPAAEFLNDDEIMAINDALHDCEEAGSPVDHNKFLAWLGVETLAYVPRKRFGDIMRSLKEKLKKAGAK